MILAGITIATLTGENGLFARAQRAKIKSQLASAKEEVSLAIAAKISENYDNIDSITPKMVVDEINKNREIVYMQKMNRIKAMAEAVVEVVKV